MEEQKKIEFTLNGETRQFWIRPDETLLDLLRGAGLMSVKHGCGEATCGACTVIMDDRTVYSCITYAFQAQGRRVWTAEGVGSYAAPHPFQQALVEEGAVQCGFCIPGMVLSAKALLDRNPAPDDDEIRAGMDGNLCRCTGYEKIWSALRRVIDRGAGGGAR